MLLRSFSNPILKYKPSTILLCFLFCSSFLDYFFFCFFFLSLPFLLVMSHTSHLQERSPTGIGLLFLQSGLNICLCSLKSKVIDLGKETIIHFPFRVNNGMIGRTVLVVQLERFAHCELHHWKKESTFMPDACNTHNQPALNSHLNF